MSQMTGAQAILFARLLVVDNDSNNNLGLSDQNYLDLLSEQLHSYMAKFNQGVIATSNLSFASTNKVSGALPGVSTPEKLLRATVTESGTTTPLERLTIPEIIDKQLNSGDPAGTPRFWAYQKIANTINYDVLIHPTPVGTDTVIVYVEVFPSDVTSGATIPVPDADVRWLARLAAVEAARILGRPGSDIAAILAPIPEDFQAKMGLNTQALMPRVRPQKEPA